MVGGPITAVAGQTLVTPSGSQRVRAIERWPEGLLPVTLAAAIAKISWPAWCSQADETDKTFSLARLAASLAVSAVSWG